MSPVLGGDESGIIMAGALLTYFGELPKETPELDHRFWSWMKERMPFTSSALVDRLIHNEVESMLDRKVIDGELVVERIAGKTTYRKVT